jgi:hypothetical protein
MWLHSSVILTNDFRKGSVAFIFMPSIRPYFVLKGHRDNIDIKIFKQSSNSFLFFLLICLKTPYQILNESMIMNDKLESVSNRQVCELF